MCRSSTRLVFHHGNEVKRAVVGITIFLARSGLRFGHDSTVFRGVGGRTHGNSRSGGNGRIEPRRRI